MDLSVIWDAVTRNLATVSVVSLGRPALGRCQVGL